MEVKGLKLSSSFYFADFDQLKSSFKQQIFAKIQDYFEVKSSGLNVQCKTFRFCKAGKIVSKFIFLLFTFYTRSLYCLIFQSYDWWNQRQETEIRLPLQTLSAILFLSPDLSRRREHFLNKKKKWREKWECKLIFSFFFAAYPWTKSFI